MLVRLSACSISVHPAIRCLSIVGGAFLAGQIGAIARQSGVLKIIDQALESERRIERTLRQSSLKRRGGKSKVTAVVSVPAVRDVRKVLHEETYGALWPLRFAKRHLEVEKTSAIPMSVQARSTLNAGGVCSWLVRGVINTKKAPLIFLHHSRKTLKASDYFKTNKKPRS